MAKTELGCQVLQEKGHFSEFSQFIKHHSHENEDADLILKLKSILWAVVCTASWLNLPCCSQNLGQCGCNWRRSSLLRRRRDHTGHSGDSRELTYSFSQRVRPLMVFLWLTLTKPLERVSLFWVLFHRRLKVLKSWTTTTGKQHYLLLECLPGFVFQLTLTDSFS